LHPSSSTACSTSRAPVQPAADTKAIRDALGFAVEWAESPGKWTLKGYQSATPLQRTTTQRDGREIEMIKALLGAIGCAACLSVLTACTGHPALRESEQSGTRRRVGVYDSRAIAVAFVGSAAWEATAGKRLAELKAQYDKAKADGDRAQMAELEAAGKAQQTLLHKQAFSTAPVDDMLAHIKDQMPAIAKAAGVECIVSKWDKAALAENKDAELVDVTTVLVDAFKPNDRQRKSAIAIQERPPISPRAAERIDD